MAASEVSLKRWIIISIHMGTKDSQFEYPKVESNGTLMKVIRNEIMWRTKAKIILGLFPMYLSRYPPNNPNAKLPITKPSPDTAIKNLKCCVFPYFISTQMSILIPCNPTKLLASSPKCLVRPKHVP